MKELWGKPQVRLWLAVVGSGTLVLGAAYAMAQQSTRQAANDLPLAAAQSAQHELQNGANPADVVPAVKTDLANDSTVFVTVTDNTQHILASSATLDNKTSLPPIGVFSYTSVHASDNFTWQPKSGVRLATQVLSYGSGQNAGFIVAGQSLKQAEKRINTYTDLAAAAWVAMLAWSYLMLILPAQTKK